jgi:hypothetical protein
MIAYIKKKERSTAGCGGTCLSSQHWGGRGRRIYSSKLVWATYGDPVSKNSKTKQKSHKG